MGANRRKGQPEESLRSKFIIKLDLRMEGQAA